MCGIDIRFMKFGGIEQPLPWNVLWSTLSIRDHGGIILYTAYVKHRCGDSPPVIALLFFGLDIESDNLVRLCAEP